MSATNKLLCKRKSKDTRASFRFVGLSAYAGELARGAVVRSTHMTFSVTNSGETNKEVFGRMKTN